MRFDMKRTRLATLLTLLSLIGLLFSGCLGASHEAIEAAYTDADIRYHHQDDVAMAGTFNRFQVPEGTSLMEIHWIYRTSEKIHIEIQDAQGTHNHTLTAQHGGLGASSDQGLWTRADPTPGTWTIETRSHDDSSYTVGIYFDRS